MSNPSQRGSYVYVSGQPSNHQIGNPRKYEHDNRVIIRRENVTHVSDGSVVLDVHLRHSNPPKGSERSNAMVASLNPQVRQYESDMFGISQFTDRKIIDLFHHLQFLPPMDKYGPMSGNCDLQTTQMENFLQQTFRFRSLPNEYIVSGVRSFRIGRPVKEMHKDEVICFPSNTSATTTRLFRMSVDEIKEWQISYAVYADRTQNNMTKEFLHHALQGGSRNGPEAFLMKFVVRISKCPILMEFDGKVIHRDLQEQWPHYIKLVSVTGIDFAGRIHDIDDIRTYILNWQDVYEIDPQSGMPFLYHGRDFYVKRNAPPVKLDLSRLKTDLMQMARLRLNACDCEKVQIVVETGIGLGVFAGEYIGIDETVRRLSASAIRKVLEEDGPKYKNICGVVFALPIFGTPARNAPRKDTYYAFKQEFQTPSYRGRIPVLIADQDMHRLTVAIARAGFRVSELNPADSHGVFGEYWQNRGPAVEEKLALTTVGLLVQHHLINPYVLDRSHYHLI